MLLSIEPAIVQIGSPKPETLAPPFLSQPQFILKGRLSVIDSRVTPSTIGGNRGQGEGERLTYRSARSTSPGCRTSFAPNERRIVGTPRVSPGDP